MDNVLFVTPGPLKWASTRYRAVWPAEILNAAWVEISGFTEGHLNAFDTFIFIKLIDPEVLKQIKGMGKRAFYDACDPVHWFSPNELRKAIGDLDGITASNEMLALDLAKWSGYPVHTIPDRLKLEHYPNRRRHTHQDTIRFIWYGASQNRFGIYSAIANLDRLTANGFKISLTIYDDQPKDHWKWQHQFTVYHGRWQLDQENDAIAAHDIALLPPYPGPWGKVKSNNRELTAWACGLPVTDGQDYRQMSDLVALSSKRQIEADRGFKMVKADYTVEKSAEQWKELLWA